MAPNLSERGNDSTKNLNPISHRTNLSKFRQIHEVIVSDNDLEHYSQINTEDNITAALKNNQSRHSRKHRTSFIHLGDGDEPVRQPKNFQVSKSRGNIQSELLRGKKLKIFEDSQDNYFRPSSHNFEDLRRQIERHRSEVVNQRPYHKKFSASDKGTVNLFGEVPTE